MKNKHIITGLVLFTIATPFWAVSASKQSYPSDYSDPVVESSDCEPEPQYYNDSLAIDAHKAAKPMAANQPKKGTKKSQNNNQEAAKNSGCQPTSEVWGTKPIISRNTSNLLWKRTGSPEEASGKKIVITGRILDASCVPVTGARIDIMQVDNNGFDKNDQKADSNFLYSGTAITDNLGRYSFYTIMPDAAKHKHSWINASIKHDELGVTETIIFFNTEDIGKNPDVKGRNINKHTLLASYTEHDEKNNFDIYNFDIILNNVLNYKQY